ncbi:D-alanyl-D-alanine carboxypeptidase [Tersicoccus sp. MR15.9]|uniref:D-alanyl-D-alanine carboxypeptidase/D-alanyl-D-alanine-endopeptidase n=1 Tax=Tersicoccus mangrovi TaxID=3121635 RepID=UPI002FE55A65
MPASAAPSRTRGPSRAGRVLIGVLLVLAIVAVAVPVGLFALPGAATGGSPSADDVAAVPAQRTPTALAAPVDPGIAAGGTPSSGMSPNSLPSSGATGGSTGITTAPLPTAAGVAAALAAARTAAPGVDVSAAVLDAATGRSVHQDGAAEPRLPASNLKLLSSLAILTTLDPQSRLTTAAVRGTGRGDVVLVGAGDVMLGSGASNASAIQGHAGLQTLAARTAVSLRAAGVTGTVRVSVDTTRFSGPALNPAWYADDVAAGQIGAVGPLALWSGHTRPDAAPGERPTDPALAAGQAFATALRAALGSTADVAPAVTRTAAPVRSAAARLGAVDSATVGEQVQWLLEHSDNDVAEALTRVAARAAGRSTDPAGTAAFVRDTVTRLGLDTRGLVITDACGLADSNRVSAATLAGAMRRIVTDGRFGDAVAGLPVAGLTGTLDDRFTGDADAAGAGVVRAKTGTLNEASTLTGYVMDRDGRLLVFAFMASNPPGATAAARGALDRAAAALAGCGCR